MDTSLPSRHIIRHITLQLNNIVVEQDDVVELAQALERVEGLSMNDRYLICMAPVSMRNVQIVAALLHYAKRYSEQRAIALGLTAPAQAPSTVAGMAQLETLHQVHKA